MKLPDAELRTSWLYALTQQDQHHAVALSRSRARSMAACWRDEDKPLVYMEDVGRHNAVDKIAGWMFKPSACRARRQDFLHHRPAHLGDGDQDACAWAFRF